VITGSLISKNSFPYFCHGRGKERRREERRVLHISSMDEICRTDSISIKINVIIILL